MVGNEDGNHVDINTKANTRRNAVPEKLVTQLQIQSRLKITPVISVRTIMIMKIMNNDNHRRQDREYRPDHSGNTKHNSSDTPSAEQRSVHEDGEKISQGKDNIKTN